MAPLAYATLSDLKALLPGNQFGTTYDEMLVDAVQAVSRLIDARLQRAPGAFAIQEDEVRYYKGSGSLCLWIDEMAALPTSIQMATSTVVDNALGTGGQYATLGAADYFMWPDNALRIGMPFQRVDLNPLIGAYSSWMPYQRAVKITGKFGFSIQAPEEIRKAVEIQTVRMWKRAQQAFADTGAITELAQLRYVKSLDPDVESIISSDKFAVSFL